MALDKNAAADSNFRKDLTLDMLNEAGEATETAKDLDPSTDAFEFMDTDPKDYEDQKSTYDPSGGKFDGDVDKQGIVMSGGSTMYEGIVMSGGSTIYEGLTDRIVVEAARGNGEVGYEVDADMDGNDW